MIFVKNVIAVKMIFKHENFLLDLESAHRAKLYQDDKLLFLGDGYKAITILIRNSKNPAPVQEKFRNQLETRQKPKFTSHKDDIEAMRLQVIKELKPTKKKRR
jgi:hypothetical protein